MKDSTNMVFAALTTACIAHPSQRVGQVLENTAGDYDLFYMENDDLAEALLDYAKKGLLLQTQSEESDD